MQNEIRYFSMFTGIGGFEIGLERDRCSQSECRGSQQGVLPRGQISSRKEYNSFTCIGLSEIDKYSNQVLKYKFPTIKNWGDCTKINPTELPDFDMLCGGFPCQAFSIAGKRRGFEDTRGTMFFEITRILKIKRPKIILLENVKGLLNHNKGETFKVILQTLDELGYEVQWMVLNSKFFGVPQNRERVFIIGSFRGERRPKILPFGESSGQINEGEISHTLPSTYHKITRGSTFIKQLNNPTHSNNRIYGEDGISPSLNTAQGGNRQPKIRTILDLYNKKEHTDRCPTLTEPHHNTLRVKEVRAVLTPDRAEKRQNGRRFKEPGEPSFTITGQDIHGITDGIKIRRLTPTECCRLQGFPDDWNEWGIDDKGEKVKMSDTQRYKQMGNAVTTNVITMIASKLLPCTNENIENDRVSSPNLKKRSQE